MTKTCTELRAIALAQVGNGGKTYRKYVGLGSGRPWCDAWVFWLYDAHGCGDVLPWKGSQRTYAPASYAWAQKNLAQLPPYMAMPCDLIYFDWDRNGVPNHIGIVNKRRNATSVYTIEGNTSGGKVDTKARTGYILGVFRPHLTPNIPLKKEKLKCGGLFGYRSIYNLQLALGMKPTGIFTKETVKYLQRKSGATPDGVWGKETSKKVQKMVGATPIDGIFGGASVSKLQAWINKQNYPAEGKKTTATATKKTTTANTSKATKPTPKPQNKATQKKGYTGTFPSLNNNQKIINGFAYTHCWACGTPEKKYTFKSGEPRKAYATGIDKAYPKHKEWKNRKQRVGACCDIYVGECLGNVGIHVPKDLADQLVKFPKMKELEKVNVYLAKDFKGGMIVQRGRKDKSGHTWVVFEDVTGNKYIANSHYKKLGGTYAVIDAKPKNIVKSKWKYYGCYIPKGACRTWYGIGDYGKDVLYIQRFLKWYGYNLTANGYYGESTQKAVNLFQKAQGWKPCGRVGKNTIARMKACKK